MPEIGDFEQSEGTYGNDLHSRVADDTDIILFNYLNEEFQIDSDELILLSDAVTFHGYILENAVNMLSWSVNGSAPPPHVNRRVSLALDMTKSIILDEKPYDIETYERFLSTFEETNSLFSTIEDHRNSNNLGSAEAFLRELKSQAGESTPREFEEFMEVWEEKIDLVRETVEFFEQNISLDQDFEPPTDTEEINSIVRRNDVLTDRLVEATDNLASHLRSSTQEGCFIATASYGTPQVDEIEDLREYRDEVLLQTILGTFFVKAYYQLSPPIANWVSKQDWRKVLIRKVIIGPALRIVR